MAKNPLHFIETHLLEAGGLACKRFGKVQEISYKSSRTDFLTQTDLDIHDFISQALSSSFPEEILISEEESHNHFLTDDLPTNGYWILDPIDGTNNFASGIPLFGIMLARAEGTELTHSGIYLPIENHLYLAERGKGSFRNGEKISCSSKDNWKQTFGCTNASLNPKKLPLRQALNKATEIDSFWLNAFGCAAVSGAYTAEGRRDWYFSMGSHLWDYAPAALLLQEAGCLVTNFAGEKWLPGMREFLAAPPSLHDSLLQLL